MEISQVKTSHSLQPAKKTYPEKSRFSSKKEQNLKYQSFSNMIKTSLTDINGPKLSGLY